MASRSRFSVLGAGFVFRFPVPPPPKATARLGVLVMALMLVGMMPREASAQLGALVSPGRLTRAHGSLEGITNCLQCHSAGRGIAAEKCLTCHKPIADRMTQKKGVHRNVTTDCVSCHVEHAGVDAELRPFNTQRFNHATDTGFPLDGQHASLANNCAACHKTRSFLTASPSCASCHTDAHKGSLGTDCAKCHTTTVKFAESRTKFDHSRTSFPLVGAHASVTCASCHTSPTYKGVTASCASCHKDPHREQFGSACASCHTSQTWRTTKIDHSRTAFPLRGQHASVTCVSCHTKPALQVKPKSDTCASCHTDPHRGVFKQDCSSCHTETTFKKPTGDGFDHSTTKFPLVDKHAGLACAACHTSQGAGAPAARPVPPPPARRTNARTATRSGSPGSPSSSVSAGDFSGLKAECASCHADVHRAELGSACERCHTARTFEVPAFTHAHQSAFFAGQHASLRCAQCHTTSYRQATAAVAVTSARPAARPAVVRTGFTQTAEACASCHMDAHLGQLGARCETCHTVAVAKFAVQSFQHSSTRFPLTGKHAPLACQACHAVATQDFPAGHGTATRFAAIGTDCASCHQDPHRAELGRDCQRCHSTETFAIKRYTHLNARSLAGFFTGRHVTYCAACHKSGPARTGGATTVLASYRVSTACTACHNDIHRGALGPRCETCHKP